MFPACENEPYNDKKKKILLKISVVQLTVVCIVCCFTR